MSKFEAELRLPTKQQYAYINMTIRSDSGAEFVQTLKELDEGDMARHLVEFHTKAYAMVMGGVEVELKKATEPRADQDPRDLIVSELGGKVIAEVATEAAPQAQPEKPWERTKPAAKKQTSSNDPFAGLR